MYKRQDGYCAVSGAVKACAFNLGKLSNDLRLMSSGPRTGFGEINLPAKQNGSSIMPGKAVSYTHLDVYKRQA